MRFLADENFNGHLYQALRARMLTAVFARVQDVGLIGADDPTILEWAAQHAFVVLTHDKSTFTDFAYARVAEGLNMPGVLQVRRGHSIQKIVDDVELLFECSSDEDLKDLVLHLPF